LPDPRLAESYQGVQEPWKEVCAEVLQCRGLRLRPGITLDDFVSLLIAIGEGVGLRILADPDAKLLDYGERRSLLGTGGLALILGCIERDEDADGQTLEQAVHTMMYDRRRPRASRPKRPVTERFPVAAKAARAVRRLRDALRRRRRPAGRARRRSEP
jgi:hypothetical protein